MSVTPFLLELPIFMTRVFKVQGTSPHVTHMQNSGSLRIGAYMLQGLGVRSGQGLSVVFGTKRFRREIESPAKPSVDSKPEALNPKLSRTKVNTVDDMNPALPTISNHTILPIFSGP